MTRRGYRIAVCGVALALAAAVTGVASAQDVTIKRSGIVPFRTGAAPLAAADLEYHGGYIQDHVAVYLVFWGSQWASDANGVQDYVTNFFAGLGTSADAWSTVTSQYTGQGGAPTFAGSVLKGSWVDGAAAAPAQASASDVAAEAERAVSHFGVAVSNNLSVIVLSPQGTQPDGFPNSGWCAWHSASPAGVPFTNMPYVLDVGGSCGENSVGGRLDGFSVVGGHEYAETVTDPFPESGWVDASGEENADKCAWQNLHTISLPTGTFAVQPTWSNKVHGCAG